LQQLRILFGEAIKTRTAQTIFAFDEKAKRYRKFAKRFLIGLDSGQSRNEISFAVCRPTRLELSVYDG
jgi:hypothetical protein